MSSLSLSEYFDKPLKNFADDDVDERLSFFCFMNENNEVILDFRLYKKLYIHYDKVLEYTTNVFKNLEAKQKEDPTIKNIIHLNVKNIHLTHLEKYHKSITSFMNALMIIFPNYELDKCYTYNASIIFVAVKKLAQTVYYNQDIKNKIIIQKD